LFKWKLAALFAVFGVLYPLIIIASVSLPTWWASFTSSSISSYEAYMPVLANGPFWSHVVISDEFVMKLYPDILIFYLFIYVVTLVGLTAQFIPQLQDLLLWKPNLLPFSVAIGEMFVLTAAVAVYSLQFWYWRYHHQYENSSAVRSDDELIARSLGQVQCGTCT
jgi:hypothetical protein